METNENPGDIVEALGLAQISDEGAIEAMVNAVLDKNPQSFEDYKNGKTRALGFLVGMVMKESKGKGNPQLINKMILERLEAYKNNQ